MYTKSYDIFCVSETWLNETIYDNEILPSNYTIYRNDRRSRGGGVLIAVSNSIPSKIIKRYTGIEMISVELELSPKLLIVCLYIPPNCSDEYQQDVLRSIQSLHTHNDVILLGDLNAPDVNWSTLSASSPFSSSLCNAFYSNNYIQMVTQPTHHKGNTLDLIFTNAPARLNNICVDSTGKFLKSDHYPVTADIFSISIHTNTHPPNQPAPLNYLKADLPQLAYHLSLDIETFTQTLGNSPIVWEDLKYVILNCCECFIPRAKIPSKPSPRWFNSSIRHQLNRTRTLKRRVKKRPTLHMQDKLTTAELTLQTAMLEAKENYLSTLVGSFKTQPKKLYGYLNSLTESKYKPQSIVHNNQIVRDPRQKAELFNKFFNLTFTKSNFKLPPVSSLQVPTIQLSRISFTELEVYEALAQLDPQKAMGCDMISPLVLKLCADTLAQPLHSFFSTCIELGTIPQEWKIHKICPIPKSGNLLEVKNYRPISLLSIVSKVLERIIFNKIIDFLRPKFSKQQFGFQKNKSSLSQLLSSFAYILEEIDKGSTVDMIFLDLKKAFDTVPHEELLFKLWNIGITGPLWFWFKSYLANRQHFVSVDNNSSTLLPVLSGVPQGSILGPVLFLVYINDLPEQINYASCYLFADDTKLIKSIRGINDRLLMQSDVDSLHRWCEQWKLKLNASKCQTLSVSLSNHHQNHQCQHYSIDGAKLDSTNSQRDLGVLVKCDLSWTDHLNQICGRGYRSLNMIRRTIPPGVTIILKKQLYISLVRSHLTYCSQLWRPRMVKDILSVERVQRKATKYVLSDYSNDYKLRLQSLHMLPLMYWLELQDIMFLVKCLQDPHDCMNIRSHVSFSPSGTRAGSGNKLKYEYRRTSNGRHFYFNRIVRLWNKLPSSCIDLTKSFATVRHTVRAFLWTHFENHFDPKNTCTFHLVCPCYKCHLGNCLS